MKRKTKYKLTIEFETDQPVKKVANWAVQFENGLTYFVEGGNINEGFVYGSGRTTLKKVRRQ